MDCYKHIIQIKVENFFKEYIQQSLKKLENYVIDFFVSPEKVSSSLGTLVFHPAHYYIYCNGWNLLYLNLFLVNPYHNTHNII